MLNLKTQYGCSNLDFQVNQEVLEKQSKSSAGNVIILFINR